MISNFYRHTLSVEPLEASSKKQTYGTAYDLKCFVQPISIEDALQADGIFQFHYKCYCDIDATLVAGSRATFDGEVYIVKEPARFRIPNRDIQHLKFILAKVKDD